MFELQEKRSGLWSSCAPEMVFWGDFGSLGENRSSHRISDLICLVVYTLRHVGKTPAGVCAFPQPWCVSVLGFAVRILHRTKLELMSSDGLIESDQVVSSPFFDLLTSICRLNVIPFTSFVYFSR